jgi:hypothetical protein
MADESKGGAAVATKPESKQQQKPQPQKPAAAVVAPADAPVADPEPKLGEIVFYVLAEGPNKGQRRPAIVTFIWPDGGVNLICFPGKANDFASAANGGPTPMPGRTYDPDGAPGTWHRDDDPAADAE